MSELAQATLNETPNVQQAEALMIEYGKKLRELAVGARNVRNGEKLTLGKVLKVGPLSEDVSELVMKAKYLIPAAETLARFVSGMIQNARTHELDKITLQLRLAEFEPAIITAQNALWPDRPQFGRPVAKSLPQ